MTRPAPCDTGSTQLKYSPGRIAPISWHCQQGLVEHQAVNDPVTALCRSWLRGLAAITQNVTLNVSS